MHIFPGTSGIAVGSLIPVVLWFACSHTKEHERVAGNPMGAKVLERLVKDEILYKEGNFYFVRPAEISTYLGVSWTDLRDGVITEKLVKYLTNINV